MPGADIRDQQDVGRLFNENQNVLENDRENLNTPIDNIVEKVQYNMYYPVILLTKS